MTQGRQFILAALLLLGVFLVWQLAQILLLLFASIIFATVIWSMAAPLAAYTPLGRRR